MSTIRGMPSQIQLSTPTKKVLVPATPDTKSTTSTRTASIRENDQDWETLSSISDYQNAAYEPKMTDAELEDLFKARLEDLLEFQVTVRPFGKPGTMKITQVADPAATTLQLDSLEFGPIARLVFKGTELRLEFEVPYGVLQMYCPAVERAIDNTSVKLKTLQSLTVIIPIGEGLEVGINGIMSYILAYRTNIKDGKVKKFGKGMFHNVCDYKNLKKVAEALGMTDIAEEMQSYIKDGDHDWFNISVEDIEC